MIKMKKIVIFPCEKQKKNEKTHFAFLLDENLIVQKVHVIFQPEQYCIVLLIAMHSVLHCNKTKEITKRKISTIINYIRNKNVIGST